MAGLLFPVRKAYPHHVDGLSYYPDMGSVDRELQDIIDKGTESGTEALRRFGPLNKRPSNDAMYRKSEASFNDPVAVYFALDAIVNCQRGIYIRPAYLTAYLRAQIPQYYWGVGTVGRIMAGFWRVCSEVYLLNQDPGVYIRAYGPSGPLGVEAQMKLIPFAQGRDSTSKYYVIDPEGGNEGLLWLLQARRRFLDKAFRYMQDEQRGTFMTKSPEWGDGFGATEYFESVISEPARSPVAYKNQLQGGAEFVVTAAPRRAIRFSAGPDDASE